MTDIEENLQDVLYRIKMAAEKVHRDFDDVTLVAVTKGFDVSTIKDAIKLNIKDIGETRIQETIKKQKELGNLSKKVKWHMIGYLQSNKAKDAAKIFDFIHSIDRMKVAKKISESCLQRKKEMPVLVQVNSSGLTHGIKPEKIVEFVNELRKLNGIQVRGLMTIAPLVANNEETRPYFRSLRQLAKKCYLKQLSMGMSNDFEVAIQEGATMVRIGTELFGKRRK
jgi:pyridoxal phosphate enzyme (YggS family)